jgi:hypothetical protein
VSPLQEVIRVNETCGCHIEVLREVAILKVSLKDMAEKCVLLVGGTWMIMVLKILKAHARRAGCCSDKKEQGVHIFPGLNINIKNPRGLVGNTPVGTPSQLVCHRFESQLGHGGSSPLPADKHSSWERKVLLLAISQLALSFFIQFIRYSFITIR